MFHGSSGDASMDRLGPTIPQAAEHPLLFNPYNCQYQDWESIQGLTSPTIWPRFHAMSNLTPAAATLHIPGKAMAQGVPGLVFASDSESPTLVRRKFWGSSN